MTVVDTSGVVDLLLGGEAATDVEALLKRERVLAAPDLLVFETLAVLRRDTARGLLTSDRADRAVIRLGQSPMILFPTLGLRRRAWALRENFRMADALFVALAEELGEPLATKDAALVAEAQKHSNAELVLLGAS